MSNGSEAFGAVLVVFIVFGAPIVAIIIHRVLQHQERMAYINRGLTPPPTRREMRDAQRAARAGIPYPHMQTPPPPPGAQTYIDPGTVWYPTDTAQAQLRKGISLTLIGLALFIGLSFIGYGPWLLGGLVPMFAGIAQVMIAVLSGARLGVANGNYVHGPEQRPTSAPPPPSPPPSNGPYGYRPDPSVTPLERPGDIQR